jgi:hypothetical protein
LNDLVYDNQQRGSIQDELGKQTKKHLLTKVPFRDTMDCILDEEWMRCKMNRTLDEGRVGGIAGRYFWG